MERIGTTVNTALSYAENMSNARAWIDASIADLGAVKADVAVARKALGKCVSQDSAEMLALVDEASHHLQHALVALRRA